MEIRKKNRKTLTDFKLVNAHITQLHAVPWPNDLNNYLSKNRQQAMTSSCWINSSKNVAKRLLIINRSQITWTNIHNSFILFRNSKWALKVTLLTYSMKAEISKLWKCVIESRKTWNSPVNWSHNRFSIPKIQPTLKVYYL